MTNDPNIKSHQEEEPRRLVASDGRASILSSKATQTPDNFEYSEHYDKFRRKDKPKIAIGKVIKITTQLSNGSHDPYFVRNSYSLCALKLEGVGI